MRNITIVHEDGRRQAALIAETDDDVKHIVMTDKKVKFKERLYTGYLIIGSLAFALGIIISLKRINGK
jgi:hypothetical protein